MLKTIRSFGSVPEGITLSPPMVVPGATDATPRTFAFILSSNNLTMLDVTHPDRREISIRLDLGGTPVIPQEVVFAPNTASAYVRSDNARDVLQVILEAVPADDAGARTTTAPCSPSSAPAAARPTSRSTTTPQRQAVRARRDAEHRARSS